MKLRFVCFNFLIGCQRRVQPLVVWQSKGGEGDGVVDNGGDAALGRSAGVFIHSFVHSQTISIRPLRKNRRGRRNQMQR